MTRTDVASGVVRSSLPGVPEIDRLVFQTPDCFRLPREQISQLRPRLIREAVRFHRDSCPEYGSFLGQLGFDPDDIADERDLDRVPQFPASVYKRRPVTSTPPAEVVQTFHSSGTSGRLSSVPRDEATLQRLLGSIRAGLEMLEPLTGEGDPEDNVVLLNLGPPRSAAGSLWFSYVMTLVEILAPTHHYGTAATVRYAEAADDLAGVLAAGKRAGVIGSPLAVRRLAEYCLANNRTVAGGDAVFVMTGGGWKQPTGEELSRIELDTLLMKAFGVHDASQLRDAFNQVEMNSVLLECEQRRKHLPPWLYAVTRDPRDLAPLPRGAAGLLSFVDPTAGSFPCFVLSDDIGVVHEPGCPCGRTTETVEITRRVRRSQELGCALQTERLQAERQLADLLEADPGPRGSG
ncbi:MAG TPA: hypothetical protein VFM55_09760 [Micromonosporaceae bacterium]|nr:hypothetical protein [Micromonosporaceae bacterium]